MSQVFVRFLAVIRDGLAIWWLMPLIPLIVVLPEFVQHIAEIRLGMFESQAAFGSLAGDPTRMAFGVMKIAGLFLAILATIRFWATRADGRAWYSLKGILRGRLAASVVLLSAAGIPGMLLADTVGANARMALDIALSIATLPLFIWLVSALIGDPALGFGEVWRKGWLPALRIAVFAAVLWVPLQWLHEANHGWAMGASGALVWTLMAFDALVVGLLATMAGTAFYHGYYPLSPRLPGENTDPAQAGAAR